jgi:hypothetical protein
MIPEAYECELFQGHADQVTIRMPRKTHDHP